MIIESKAGKVFSPNDFDSLNEFLKHIKNDDKLKNKSMQCLENCHLYLRTIFQNKTRPRL